MLHVSHRPGALRRGSSRALALAGLALFTWACQDTTAPTVSPADGTAPRLGQASPYYCSTRAATPSGAHEGWIPLSFPREARSGDGSVMEYRYRRQTPSGVVTYTADCVIPRTMSALESMNQRFRVPPELRAPKGRDRDGGEFTTQGCVTEQEGCELDPIVVVAPPTRKECDPTIDLTCQESSGSGSGSTGDGSGGGGGSGGTTYDDSPAADDMLLDCHLSGVPCTLIPARDDEKTAMKKAIQEHIVESRCSKVYNRAMSLVENSQVWEEAYTSAGSTYRGDYLREKDEMHVWTGNFSSPHKWLPWTLAHEAVHALQFELGLTTHEQIHNYGDSCLNFSM